MPESVFQFKQFRVLHGTGGLKVTTEACLFGAIVCHHFQPARGEFEALDIGTGTGLLALMLTQRYARIRVDAVELQEKVARQANNNVLESPWCDQIHVHHTSVTSFQPAIEGYDLIISNPPFYHRHLQSPDNPGKTMAMHTISLSYEQLATSVHRLLSSEGSFYVLYPPGSLQQFIPVMEQLNMAVVRQWHIRQRPGAPVSRIVAEFKHEKATSRTTDIIIRHQEGGYHDQFIEYLRPYYFKL